MVQLSVAIPTYNRPELLERALGSVLADAAGLEQDLEIVVSDNSTDERAAEVFDRLTASWHGRSRYVHNRPGIPIVVNFNQCIALSSGRWLLVLADDDHLLPNGIRTILSDVRLVSMHDRVMLFGVDVVTDEGAVLRRQTFARQQYLGRRAALERVLTNSSFVRGPAIVVRRDAYADVGVFDPTFGDPTDLDMYVRLFANYGAVCFPHTTAVYSVHEDAATSSMFEPATISTIMQIFERATERGMLEPRRLRRCEADWFHQFVLAGALRRLRVADRPGARRVLRLLALPKIRRLGTSRRWFAASLVIRAMTRLSPAAAVRVIRWWDRLDPDHRLVPAR